MHSLQMLVFLSVQQFQHIHIDWYYYTKGVTPNPPGLAYKQTTCSYDAFLQGPNQKIISFSFYVNIETDRTKNKGYFDQKTE